MPESNQETRVERTYYPNGQLSTEVTYVGDHICGVTRYWHENGVLKKEVPMKDSLVYGTVRQWDSDGTLLGESEFINGTGVTRSFYDNGQMAGEGAAKDGMQHGRERVWDEEGTLLGEEFFVSGRRLSKKKYQEACAEDSSLPRYDPDDSTIPLADTYCDVPIESHIMSTADYDDARDAMEWLHESSEKSMRSFGELASDQESIELVQEYLDSGATRVLAIEIDVYDDGCENTGHLLVELPTKAAARRTVLEMCNEQNRAMGFSPVTDSGQKFVRIGLD